HNRCLSGESSYLWEYVTSLEVQFIKEVELPETKKRSLRTATLEIRYCPVSINPPVRLKKSGNFNVYAVYATEINVPDGCEPVSWMLLTSELVSTQQEAEQILRWYTYRWKIEEYHKILKSGCKAESYRLAGEKQVNNVGFLNSYCSTITANDLFASEFSAQFGRISVNKNTNGRATC
ncbi:MAG: transposase, partial [Nostoc sp.]